MNEKKQRIIDYLSKMTTYVSVRSIAANCDLSIRSVYNYLDMIKKDAAYRLDIQKKGGGIKLISITGEKERPKIPSTFRERRNFILRKTLIQFKTLDITDLIAYFCISESTFHTELVRMRKEISGFHVKIATKNNKLFLEGEEKARKALMTYLIYQEGTKGISPVSLEHLQEMFADLNISKIRKILIQEIEKENCFIDEYSMINLLLHFLLFISQHLNDQREQEIADSTNVKNESPLITRICEILETEYAIQFLSNEREVLSVILETRLIGKSTRFDIYQLKHREAVELASKIIENVYEVFNLDLNVADFKYPFILHLDNLIERLEKKIRLFNPLLNNIKMYSPITYDIAIYTTKIISGFCQYAISESEIAYIALHLGVRLEEIKNNRTRLKTVIVCPQYFSYNTCKLREIGKSFKEDLYILNAYASEADLDSLEDIDLIISTITIRDNELRRITVHVSDFFTTEDKLSLIKMIEKRKKELSIDQTFENLKTVFDKRIFFLNVSFQTKEEAIDYMAEQMFDEGFVSYGFKAAAHEREKIAPTDFNRIAIPHPVESFAENTKISVALLKKPLQWRKGRQEIDIIFMIAFNEKEFPFFENIFTALTALCTDSEKIKKLHKSKSYDDFIQTLYVLLNI